MKILLIGDSLSIMGGVPNYTRPLFDKLSENGMNVSYLFTSSYLHHYSFFKKSKIYKIGDNIFEWINCPLLANNLLEPYKDISNHEIEEKLGRFLMDNKFTHVHIHSMLGLTASVYKLIKELGIRLFVTVHEYWWLCPHKVMVDFNRKICEGPSNMQKCAFCVSQKQTNKSDAYVKFISRLKNDFPFIIKTGLAIKNKLISNRNDDTNSIFENIDFGKSDYKDYHNQQLEKQLQQRLDANIAALNMCDKVIAVSSDVKRILTKYGVKPDKILVQHIGSTIAEKSIQHQKEVNPNKVVFGFIGGVGYYKGVHQLVDAFSKLPKQLKEKAELKIYGKYSVGYYNAIQRDLIKDNDKNRIHFYGRFSPGDLPDITNQIDISVLPSLCADTAPQTIFESFSSGLPIIAPRVGGFPDFIQNNQNGLLYEAASVNDLKNQLEYVINHPEIINRFRNNIPKIKTMTENAKELIELYNTLK